MGNYYLVPMDELYHHGVKGMKWGVRKDKDKVTRGDVRKAAVKKWAYDHARRTAATYTNESVTSRQFDVNRKQLDDLSKKYDEASKELTTLKNKRREQKQEQKQARAEARKESGTVKKGAIAASSVVAAAVAAGVTVAAIRNSGSLSNVATLYDANGNVLRRVRQ